MGIADTKIFSVKLVFLLHRYNDEFTQLEVR
jgi:hypothetical protein